MTEKELDNLIPKLTEHEIAIAICTCKTAGAINAANALSKHITRLQLEIDLLKKQIKEKEERS